MGVGLRKPVAIIGTGPCLKDISDVDALLANRWCLALNAARRHVKTQAVIFVHKDALLKYSWTVDKDTYLIIHKEIDKWLAHQQEIYPDWEYERFAARNGTGDMALVHAMHYLYNHGWGEIEIYGIDLNSWGYLGQKRHVLQAMGNEIKLINCCPSSEFKEAEFQERPWTNAVCG